MKAKLTTLIINLLVGVAILWVFDLQHGPDGSELRLAIGYSVTSAAFILLAFHWIKAQLRITEVATLAIAVGFLVPVIAMPLSLLNPDTINDNVNNVLLDAYAGVLFWKWSVPMTLINFFLFGWVSRNAAKPAERLSENSPLTTLETDSAFLSARETHDKHPSA